MSFSILQTEIQDFIEANAKVPISKLVLMKNPFPELPWISIIEQIESKQKSEHKLPTWFTTKNIIFPKKISVEQTSSEKTAAYKASLLSGESLIDLTGGFGVDSYYFSKKFRSVVHCELDVELSSIAKHNFKQLSADNITCYNAKSEIVLDNLKTKFDWIYIDPSRRNDVKGKVFMLQDCLPNVPELLDNYFSYSNNILVKTAPILDIAAGLNELKFVRKIHIVAVDNEVKELLWEISKQHTDLPEISTVNIKKESQEYFHFRWSQNAVPVRFALPKTYIYEPNSAVMKSGGFNEVGNQFDLEKLHIHSHLYTSEQVIDFPGRVFKIESVIPFQKNEMKSVLEGKKANVTTRNFPNSVEEIRKKWKISEGGNLYCFFTTDLNNNKIVLLCNKI